MHRPDAAVPEGLAQVVARKRVVQIVRDLAERHVGEEERCQEEIRQQMPLTIRRLVGHGKKSEGEPDGEQQQRKVVIRRADCPHVHVAEASDDPDQADSP